MGPVCGVGTSGSGEGIGKGTGEWIWWKYYALTIKTEKMKHFETVPGLGRGG
jgi:hypothetical protein